MMRKSDSVRGVRRHGAIRWFKRGVLALVTVGGIYALVSAWIPQPVVVDVGLAARDRLQVFVEEDGRTRVREHYLVAAPLSGTLERIRLKVGDTVSKGEVVARLASPAPTLLDARNRAEIEARLTAAVARKLQADAVVGRAVARRELATTEAVRARKLAPGVMSVSDRDRFLTEERVAVGEHTAAVQQRNSAAADVDAIRATLGTVKPGTVRPGTVKPGTVKPGKGGYVEVRAPVSGSVLRILVDSESPVAVGTPLLEIGDTSALEVVVDVLSSDAVAIKPGAELWIQQWGGSDLHGSVTRVEPSAFTHISALGVEEQRTNVIAEIDDPPAALGDGYRIEARILTWEGQDIISVPASAVFRHRKGWAVYVVDKGTARLREIAIGHRSRHDVEVTSGLEAGRHVVLYPGDKLRNGTSIHVRDGP